MHQGQLVFSQLMRHLPLTTFRRCVARYAGEHKVKSFSCLDQYLCMAFAQLTYRESLRDIESSLRAQAAKLYHLGIRGNVSRNTLANANATRDWRIYASFAERLISIARGLYAEEPFGVDLAETVYALDPNYQPIFFYMRSKLVYASEIDEVPTDARYLLVRPEREQEVLESNRWAPRRPHLISRFTDYRKESILLLKID